MQSYELLPAFSDPVQEAQAVFRTLLMALSEPGLSHEVNFSTGLGDLNPAAYAVALTLLDQSTAVWLSPELATAQIRKNLAFHCGCLFVEHPEQAQFAFLTAKEIEFLPRLDKGTDRDPELSCTAIIQQASDMAPQQSIWSGPGILDQRVVSAAIPVSFWSLRQTLTPFPRGIDVLWVTESQVLGLPRTTQVQIRG